MIYIPVSNSPAVGAASGDDTVFAAFESSFGLDIRKDIRGTTRPYGSAWDIGSYEYRPLVPHGLSVGGSRPVVNGVGFLVNQ